jgi:hypothetical protein
MQTISRRGGVKPISYLYRELIFGVLSELDGYLDELGLDENEQVFANELKEKSANLTDPLDFDEKQCEELYRSILASVLSDYLIDVQEEIRQGKVRTGLIAECGGYAESEAVAIPVTGIPSLYIGWTYFFGGGKHSEPRVIEWMENCYLVKAKDRVQTVRFFERDVPLDQNTLWEGSSNPEK